MIEVLKLVSTSITSLSKGIDVFEKLKNMFNPSNNKTENNDKNIDLSDDFLNEFILLIAKIVKYKLQRFQSAANRLKPTDNIFELITKPKDQIKYTFDELKRLLMKSFSLKENDICITILEQDNETSEARYLYSDNSWRHTEPNDLINSKSTAKDCLETGEPRFYPDKFKAAGEGKYYLTERDKRLKKGSIYCYPVFVSISEHIEDKYIISISTYNRVLCEPKEDLDSVDIVVDTIEFILEEICKRIKLELTLLSIKNWQSKIKKT